MTIGTGAPALRVYFAITDQPSPNNLNTFEQTCDNFGNLRAFVGIQGLQVFARGRASIADGYQGVFWWNPNSNLSDDNINTIVPAGAAVGAWWRLVVPINYQGLPNTSAKVTTDFTVSTVVSTYFVDSSAAPITIHMNPNPVLNEIHVIKDFTGQALPNPISLDGNGHLIDGQATITNAIQTAYGWLTIQWNGTGWSLI